MAELKVLDRAHATVMRRIIDSGRAPHFTELASHLGIPIDEAKQLVHELVAMIPGWVHPGTDLLASFPPFNLQPTQYKVRIDGEHRWYAQCGFEALAVRWLVPGRRVHIEAPCLCCGDPLLLDMDDETITSILPATMVGYTSAEVGGDAASRPFR